MIAHWANEHNPDGLLKPGTLSFDPKMLKSAQPSNQNKASNNQSKDTSQSKSPALGFMAITSSSDDVDQQSVNTHMCTSPLPLRSLSAAPMVDPGVPFSSIGEIELRYRRNRLTGGMVVL